MTWTLKFEVAFDTNPGDEPGVWTDLSSRLRGSDPIDVSAGAGRLAGGDGRCEVTLDNYDRAIDPTNTAAIYNLIPMRHARLQAIVNATTYPLFRGLVDEWPPMWSDVDSLVRVRLVDGFAWLALQDADMDLPAQMTHERITALLDLAGWPAGLRDIGTGVIPVEPYEQASGNLLRVMRDTADAEMGDLYVAPDGKITFRSRHARFDLTPSIVFGAAGVSPQSADPAWDTAQLTTISRVELADGTTYEAVDDTQRTAVGPRVMPIRDLSLRKAEAEAMAQWELVRFSTTRLWVDDLTVNASDDGPDGDDGPLEALLALRIGQLATHTQTPPSGAAIDVDLCVERITHTIYPNDWEMRFDLSPYFGAGPWFTFDDPALGWDSGAKWAP